MTAPAATGDGRLLIVESVTKKRGEPGPARDVYASRLWTARRRHAEARGLPWLILSSRHGLLRPDQPIEPYELPLGDLDAGTIDAVAARAIEQLRADWPLRGRIVEAHVREEYGERLAPAVSADGGRLELPLRGLSVCGQLGWYRGEPAAASDACPLEEPASSSDPRSISASTLSSIEPNRRRPPAL